MSLRGCRVLYTGPEPPPQAFQVHWLPLITLEPVKGASLEFLKAYRPGALVVVTSPRAPRLLILDAAEHRVACEVIDAFRSAVVAAVGRRTESEARRLLGAGRSFHAPGQTVESLAEALRGWSGPAVVLRASNPSPSYERLLEALGSASEVVVYKNIVLRGNSLLAAELAAEGIVDVVALSSPLQAHAMAEGLSGRRPASRIAVIGPSTAEAARRALGVEPVEAREPSVRALLEAAVEACRG